MEDEEYYQEKELSDSPKSISFEVLELLIPKAKTCICKIKCSKGGFGTGFFCNVENDFNEIIKVLMTNNHVLNQEDILAGKLINFSISNEKTCYEIQIDESRKKYTSDVYDITIIELKESDKLDKIDYFDIDKRIFNENPNEIFRNMEIFLLHYPKGKKMEYSLGLIKSVYENNYTLRHSCDSNTGSSGAPIINTINFQVIGIHKGGAKRGNYNLGTILREPLEKFKVSSNISDDKAINENSLIPGFDSLIIQNNYSNSLIKSWISPDFKIKANLLYRMSRDGEEISTFHNLCDNKGPETLVLFHLKNGNIIGFFIHGFFDSVSDWKVDNLCMIFNLNQKKVYKLTDSLYYAYNSKANCGPSVNWLGCNTGVKLNYIYFSPKNIDTVFNGASKILPLEGRAKISGESIEFEYEAFELEVFQIITLI